MKKHRILALDGLRGFAAFSVFLSHSGFNFSDPILKTIYQIFSVGPNSVQILFVLSGFLMAFLYRRVDVFSFLQKRYTRVFPAYIVVVFFFWLTHEQNKTEWYLQIIIFLAIAIAFHLLWRGFRRIGMAKKMSKKILGAYLSLQALVLIYGIFFFPKLLQSSEPFLNTVNNVFPMFSNMTLTTPFAPQVSWYTSVFWSLSPEILFYLIYPFFVIPVIRVARKWGAIGTFIIIISITKIFFDLDNLFFSEIGLRSMQIGRSTGFIVGVLIGTIYQSRGTIWNKIEKISKNPIISILALLGLVGIQWADGAIRHGSTVPFTRWYYLISSIVIGAVVISAIIPNTLINKIFRQRIVVFLGLVSYSLYITHIIAIEWVESLLIYFNIPHDGIFTLTRPTLMITIAILVAYILFRLIENMYFLRRKKVRIRKPLKEQIKIRPKKTFILAGLGIYILIFVTLYSREYALSLALARHSMPANIRPDVDISLLENPVSIPVKALHGNLSIIKTQLRYENEFKDAQEEPAQLVFKLYDNKNLIFESKRSASEVVGTPRFPFGFPTIADSKNKNYRIELSLLNGSKNDNVFFNTSSKSIVTVYSILREGKSNVLTLVLNRFIFTFSNLDLLFALGFGIFMARKIYKTAIK